MNETNHTQSLIKKVLVIGGIALAAIAGGLKGMGKGIGKNADDLVRAAGQVHASQMRQDQTRVGSPKGKFQLPTLGNLPPNNSVKPNAQPDNHPETGTMDGEFDALIQRIIKSGRQQRGKSQTIAKETQAYWNLVITKHHLFRFGDWNPPDGVTQEEFLERTLDKFKSTIQLNEGSITKDVEPQLVFLSKKILAFDRVAVMLLAEVQQSYEGLGKREQKIANQQLKEDARQKHNRGLEFFGSLSSDEYAKLPNELKELISQFDKLGEWRTQLVTDTETLQVTLEERYRGTSFDLPALSDENQVRWPVGGKTQPSDPEETASFWKTVHAPTHAFLERCFEDPEPSALWWYASKIKRTDVSEIKDVDTQLNELLKQHFEIENQIADLNITGAKIASSELGADGDDWLLRLSQLPTGKLSKVDAFMDELSPKVEQLSDLLWKTQYLKAILEERYPGADFSLPRFVAPGESKWVGTCTEDGKKPYPMILIGAVSAEGKLVGTIHWPELSSSVTRINGSVRGKSAVFTEGELISGFGVGIPCRYSAKYDGEELRGTGTFNDNVATFSLKLLEGTNPFAGNSKEPPAQDSSKPAASSDEISRILNKFVGQWKIEGAQKYKIIAQRIGKDDFVIIRTYEDQPTDDNFVGLQYIWYDKPRSQFRYMAIQTGKPLITFTGEWDERSQTMLWQLPDEQLQVVPGLSKEIREVFSGNLRESSTRLIKDEEVVRMSQGMTFEFDGAAKPLGTQDALRDSSLASYVGSWKYTVVETGVKGTVKIDSVGESKPMLIVRYYGPTKNLSEVRLMFDDGNGKYTQMYTTNVGLTINLSGSWNDDKKKMTWSTVLEGQELAVEDQFTESQISIHGTIGEQAFFESEWVRVPMVEK